MLRRSATALLLAATLSPLAIPVLATPAATSGAGQRVDAHGVSLWYEVRGNAAGRPLVMVNGGPGFDHTYVLCSDAWDQLAKSRRVVFYDQRGTGRSSAVRSYKGTADSARGRRL
ncbi:MAG: alpha/beta hydrolase [Candidatus Eisenbacteria bacterium]